MKTVRSAADTRRRLLAAGTDEFAGFGLAGARVERIVAAARCNKQSLYAYFGSKEGLFDAVYDAMVAETVHDVPIDANDLPEYAARLYDRHRDRPEVMRLFIWHQLERSTTPGMPESSVLAAVHKVAAIEAAQDAGRVTSRIAAPDLITLIHKLSAGFPLAPEATGDAEGHAKFRKVLIETVARIVAP